MPKTRKNRSSKTRRNTMKQFKKIGSALNKIGFLTKKGTMKIFKKGKKIVMKYNKSFF